MNYSTEQSPEIVVCVCVRESVVEQGATNTHQRPKCARVKECVFVVPGGREF